MKDEWLALAAMILGIIAVVSSAVAVTINLMLASGACK